MRSARKRNTVIGLVLEEIYTDFSKELIQSVLDAIPTKKDIRLVVLAGKYDHGDSTYTDHVYKTVYNTIFKLGELCELDGLIIHLGSVSSQRGERLVEKQLERYKSVPKVFIACDNPELLTVNYDNETGIRQAVDLLVNVNGLTKICMLGGRDDNTDAQLRKEIFARCLKENGIEFTDKNYVHSGMSIESEKRAAELLDK
ncbi:MAG: LacI family DNA-binding transcriptional regulator, partial [Ruminococcus sp.]|nr:LacI family DNA-binding transcriptional regulator [Ruminococcus sp.]